MKLTTQKEYVDEGVRIVRPKGIEVDFKYVLPPFVRWDKDKLIKDVHYYVSLSDIQKAYPISSSLNVLKADDVRFQLDVTATNIVMPKKRAQRDCVEKNSIIGLTKTNEDKIVNGYDAVVANRNGNGPMIVSLKRHMTKLVSSKKNDMNDLSSDDNGLYKRRKKTPFCFGESEDENESLECGDDSNDSEFSDVDIMKEVYEFDELEDEMKTRDSSSDSDVSDKAVSIMKTASSKQTPSMSSSFMSSKPKPIMSPIMSSSFNTTKKNDFSLSCQNCEEVVNVDEEHVCLKPSNAMQNKFVVCAAKRLCVLQIPVPVNGGHTCLKCNKPVHAMCGERDEKSYNLTACSYCLLEEKNKEQDSDNFNHSVDLVDSSDSDIIFNKKSEKKTKAKKKTTKKATAKKTTTKSKGSKNESAASSSKENEDESPLYNIPTIQPHEIYRYDLHSEFHATNGKGNKKAKEKKKEYSYIGQAVAFSLDDGNFMHTKAFEEVGGSYITGSISETKMAKSISYYRIVWDSTEFQRVKTWVKLETMTIGICHYNKYMKHQSSIDNTWKALCNMNVEALPGGVNLDLEKCESIDETMHLYKEKAPCTLRQVEEMKNINWSSLHRTTVPDDLYVHHDETQRPDPEKSYVKEEYVSIFKHSPAAAFLSYLSIGFWKQIVHQTNLHCKSMLVGGKLHGHRCVEITLEELFKFLGLMIYMKVVKKGEAKNYWGSAEEDHVFHSFDSSTRSTSFDAVMTFIRYKQIKASLSFRYLPKEKIAEANKVDTLWRLRPLISFIRGSCGKFVVPGRNISIDEGTEASKSRYAGNFICYNPAKPTGKHHFKYYIATAADCFVMLNIRIHGDNTELDISQGSEEDDGVEKVSVLRGLCLDLLKPYFHSRRIANFDNYYSSPQLLAAFKVKGIYSRGTLRLGRKHVPISIKWSKSEMKNAKRGDMKIMGAPDNNLSLLSWIDNNTVNLLSNCDDSSSLTTLTRKKSACTDNIQVNALDVCREYAANMQGVDRLDQNRCRFSLARGHSAKKWYIKMGLSLIDLAKSNAFLTRRLVMETSDGPSQGDQHRIFMLELVRQLITEDWKNCPLGDVMYYNLLPHMREQDTSGAFIFIIFIMKHKRNAYETNCLFIGRGLLSPIRRPHVINRAVFSPVAVEPCKATHPIYNSKSLRKGECAVCRFELRGRTRCGAFCSDHNVALCYKIWVSNPTYEFVCPDQGISCWDKFHRFYVPQGVFSPKGCINRGNMHSKGHVKARNEQDRQRKQDRLNMSIDY